MLALTIASLAGCAIVPLGYDDRYGYGYYRDRDYRADHYYRYRYYRDRDYDDRYYRGNYYYGPYYRSGGYYRDWDRGQ
jgi:hypothetical protein